MKITELPEEILLKIFQNLNLQDIFQNIALVNKKFHKISQDSELLKSLALEDIDKYVFEDFAKILQKASKLEKLQLTDCFDFTEKIVILAFKSSRVLTTLNITDTDGHGGGCVGCAHPPKNPKSPDTPPCRRQWGCAPYGVGLGAKKNFSHPGVGSGERKEKKILKF